MDDFRDELRKDGVSPRDLPLSWRVMLLPELEVKDTDQSNSDETYDSIDGDQGDDSESSEHSDIFDRISKKLRQWYLQNYPEDRP